MSSSLASPAYDKAIIKPFSVKTLEHRKENRIALLERYNWTENPKRMILCLPEGIENDEAGTLFESLVPGLQASSIGVIIRGKGPKKWGTLLFDVASHFPNQFAIAVEEDGVLNALLAGSDACLFLGNNEEMIKQSLLYGAIPIATPLPFLENYNPVQESGNAFIVQEKTVWHIFAGLTRAIETFVFPFDWKTIQKNAMKEEFTLA